MEIITENETCFTVSPGDYKALANKISELRDDLERLSKVAENAYQLYQQEFTPKILAGKIIEELHPLIKKV